MESNRGFIELIDEVGLDPFMKLNMQKKHLLSFGFMKF